MGVRHKDTREEFVRAESKLRWQITADSWAEGNNSPGTACLMSV